MTDFQKLGDQVKKAASLGYTPQQIDEWLSQAGTDLATLNASGFGPQPTSAERPGMGASFIQGAGQGTSFGLGDEAAAALAATIGRPTSGGLEPMAGETWPERYTTARDEIRGKLKEVQQANPKTYMAGEITGAIAPAIIAPELYGSNFVANAPTMGSMMARSGATGAAFGGLNAFGHAEGTPEEQAKQTAIGMVTGAAIGAVAPPIIKRATNAVKWVWNKAAGMFTPAEQVVEAAPAGMQGALAPQAQSATMPAPQVPPGMQQAPTVPQTPLQARPVTAFDDVRPRATASVSLSDKTKAINEVARALQRDGYSIDQIEQAINSLGPEATIADLGEATQRLLRTQKSAPGPAGNIIKTALTNRQVGQQGRLQEAAHEAFGVGGRAGETTEAIISQRAQNASPLYDNFYAVDPEILNTEYMQRLLQSPTGQDLLGKARMIYELERLQGRAPGNLFEPLLDAQGNITTQVAPQSRVLDYVKQAIDQEVQPYIDPVTRRVQGPLGNAWEGLRRTFVQNIDDALSNVEGPAQNAYKNARAAYSGPTRSVQAVEAGMQFAHSSDEQVARAISRLDPEDRDLFRLGALEYVKDIIKSTPPDVSVVQKLRKTGLLEKIQEMIPDGNQFSDFIKKLESERRFAETRATVMGGSQSLEKALDAADQGINLGSAMTDVATGNKGGITSRLLDWAGGKFKNMVGPGEDARAKIAQILIQTDPGKRGDALNAIAAAMAQQEAVKRGSGVIGSVGGGQAGQAGGAYWRGRQQ